MSELVLWGAGTARTLRPIWMAEELGLEYRLNAIGPRTGETQTEAYTAMTRKQKVPFLEYGEARLSESMAITRYLRDMHPHEGVYMPDTPLAHAKEDEWCNYVYGEIDETSLYVMRRHYDLTDIYGAAPEVVESCRGYLARHMAVLDAHLEKHQTLLPQGFGMADILLVSCLDWALFYSVPLPENVETYRASMAERPAYQKAMAVNYAAMMEALNGTT